MHRMKFNIRVLAPALLAVLAFLVGSVIQTKPTLGADFGTANVTRVAQSFLALPGTPFGTTTNKLSGPRPLPFVRSSNINAAVPASGLLLIYNYDDSAKDGVQIERETLTYDNSSTTAPCTGSLSSGQFCITARAKKGTTAQQHKIGSIVKLATQLKAKITAAQAPPFPITVNSTAGFTPVTADTILIDDELFTMTVVNATTWTVTARGSAHEPDGGP